MAILKQLFLLSLTLAAYSVSHASTINYGGLNYDVVDWISASTITNTAEGTANGISVTLNAFEMGSDSISTADYALDATAFGELTFIGDSSLESVSIFGVNDPFEFDTLSFSQSVNAVLFIIGAPNTTADASQFGPSQWDFDDTLSLGIVDDEPSGFVIQAGNILNAPSVNGPGGHISGVIRVSGSNLNSITWQHIFNSTSNSDKMNITFAINTTTIPLPAGVWFLLAALGALFSIKHRIRYRPLNQARPTDYQSAAPGSN